MRERLWGAFESAAAGSVRRGGLCRALASLAHRGGPRGHEQVGLHDGNESRDDSDGADDAGAPRRKREDGERGDGSEAGEDADQECPTGAVGLASIGRVGLGSVVGSGCVCVHCFCGGLAREFLEEGGLTEGDGAFALEDFDDGMPGEVDAGGDGAELVVRLACDGDGEAVGSELGNGRVRCLRVSGRQLDEPAECLPVGLTPRGEAAVRYAAPDGGGADSEGGRGFGHGDPAALGGACVLSVWCVRDHGRGSLRSAPTRVQGRGWG